MIQHQTEARIAPSDLGLNPAIRRHAAFIMGKSPCSGFRVCYVVWNTKVSYADN